MFDGRKIPKKTEEVDLTELRKAIYDKGPYPRYHDEQMRRLQVQWPTLYRAIKNLI